MKSLFTIGLGDSRDVWYNRPAPRFMGSPMLGQDYTTMSEDYRNKYLTKIGQYMTKMQSMAPVTGLATANPTAFRALMKSDADTFLSYMKEASGLYQSVQPVYARFQSDSAEEWYAAPTEMDNAENWTRLVDKMYALYQAHPMTASMQPIPYGATVPNITPPGATANLQAPQQILGIPQNTFLIGAGALGLGALIIALA